VCGSEDIVELVIEIEAVIEIEVISDAVTLGVAELLFVRLGDRLTETLPVTERDAVELRVGGLVLVGEVDMEGVEVTVEERVRLWEPERDIERAAEAGLLTVADAEIEGIEEKEEDGLTLIVTETETVLLPVSEGEAEGVLVLADEGLTEVETVEVGDAGVIVKLNEAAGVVVTDIVEDGLLETLLLLVTETELEADEDTLIGAEAEMLGDAQFGTGAVIRFPVESTENTVLVYVQLDVQVF